MYCLDALIIDNQCYLYLIKVYVAIVYESLSSKVRMVNKPELIIIIDL